ncbi:hypothetical protein PanWU01x14_012700, partial [Parasponia andersonii]
MAILLLLPSLSSFGHPSAPSLPPLSLSLSLLFFVEGESTPGTAIWPRGPLSVYLTLNRACLILSSQGSS